MLTSRVFKSDHYAATLLELSGVVDNVCYGVACVNTHVQLSNYKYLVIDYYTRDLVTAKEKRVFTERIYEMIEIVLDGKTPYWVLDFQIPPLYTNPTEDVNGLVGDLSYRGALDLEDIAKRGRKVLSWDSRSSTPSMKHLERFLQEIEHAATLNQMSFNDICPSTVPMNYKRTLVVEFGLQPHRVKLTDIVSVNQAGLIGFTGQFVRFSPGQEPNYRLHAFISQMNAALANHPSKWKLFSEHHSSAQENVGEFITKHTQRIHFHESKPDDFNSRIGRVLHSPVFLGVLDAPPIADNETKIQNQPTHKETNHGPKPPTVEECLGALCIAGSGDGVNATDFEVLPDEEESWIDMVDWGDKAGWDIFINSLSDSADDVGWTSTSTLPANNNQPLE